MVVEIRKAQKSGEDRLASPSFQNEFQAFDTHIVQNLKLETHLGNLVKTQPLPPYSTHSTSTYMHWNSENGSTEGARVGAGRCAGSKMQKTES
jgi:hypothetical protein